MNTKELQKTIWASGCFEEGDAVVVGFSGGADSLALLDGLMGLAKRKKLRVVACHVHHSIRGDEADADAAASEQLAKRLGAEFRLEKVNAPAYALEIGESLETAARILRYEALAKVAGELEAENPDREVRVAVAHTKSDLAETVLLRILRGTGPDGLAAMNSIGFLPGTDRMLVRPLLSLTAEETRAYCEGRALIAREDSSNGDPAYARSRVRTELMPILKKNYNPDAESALARLATIAAMDRDFLEMWAEQLLHALGATDTVRKALAKREGSGKKNGGTEETLSFAYDAKELPVEIALDRRELSDLHPAVGTRVIALALRSVGMTKDLSWATLWSAWELLGRGKGEGEAEFAGGFRLTLDHDLAIVRRVVEQTPKM